MTTEKQPNKFTWQVKNVLLADGFTRAEIKRFEESSAEGWFTLDATTRMRNSRRQWVAMLLAKDFTKPEIYQGVKNFYRRKARPSPWDFFREEYSRSTMKPGMTLKGFNDFLILRRQITESRKATRQRQFIATREHTNYKELNNQ